MATLPFCLVHLAELPNGRATSLPPAFSCAGPGPRLGKTGSNTPDSAATTLWRLLSLLNCPPPVLPFPYFCLSLFSPVGSSCGQVDTPCGCPWRFMSNRLAPSFQAKCALGMRGAGRPVEPLTLLGGGSLQGFDSFLESADKPKHRTSLPPPEGSEDGRNKSGPTCWVQGRNLTWTRFASIYAHYRPVSCLALPPSSFFISTVCFVQTVLSLFPPGLWCEQLGLVLSHKLSLLTPVLLAPFPIFTVLPRTSFIDTPAHSTSIHALQLVGSCW